MGKADDAGRLLRLFGMETYDSALQAMARRDMGRHPIIKAVPRHVLHMSEGFCATLCTTLNALPEQMEHCTRQIGIPLTAMRLALHIPFLVEAGPAENVIDVGNPPFEVSLPDNDLAVREPVLPVGRLNTLHFTL
ncbi:MAG: hypothetical protein OJJ21_03225 [Ferrovibrio sp.]|uniref:hypothetical protein n=1 Tax=Ferrovibrio sp. TaxID=1917215 RepID=UPI00262502D4|nr:hypothetical protein [Ferrovibrio sp.]MCW0232590.1 hypothetical protein [Ferrovibrio sp.]